MTIKTIPLSQLVPSPANVRKTGAASGLGELAASIEAHGLLQNLQVRPTESGRFEVVAGGRRLAALKLLAKRKALAKDAPIPCHVLTGETASEISLAENEMRQAMHPADQFVAFKALVDGGHGPDEIAARFGVTAHAVRQRLKLAAVSPTLFALYREGAMTLDQLMAFTVSDDHAAQEAAWFEAPDWQRSAPALRKRLTAAHVPASDRRAQFVTVEAYVAAGGAVVNDLFQTQSYLTDPALLDRLVSEKLAREAAAVRAEGWQWVTVAPEIDFDLLRGFEELRGKRQPLPPAQAKALAKAQRERERLAEQESLTDAEWARCDALDAAIAALSAAAFVFSDRQKARGGAFVGIRPDGALAVVRGLVRPAKRPEPSAADAATGAEDGPSGPAPRLSGAVAADLVAQRTAALRALLADRPDVALAALVHALAQAVFYEGGDSPLALSYGGNWVTTA
ncbi:protein of unknown function (plasmid) [Rhodovastum atsumiense]|nr:ParB/RepB/Spo0J family partition protein [Rhodovastum atsumiense]CAH2606404.1 protein of unknown function [Rhodovastum atsumiense]